MRLLVITQKVDEADDVLGFFVLWIKALSKRFDRVDVICLSSGTHHLPDNVHVYSLHKERGMLKWVQGIFFYVYTFLLLPKADGVFVHMAPEYVRALHPVNIFFKRPIIMWYAHIKVSLTAKWAIDRVYRVLTPSKESFDYDSHKVVATGHGIDTEVFKPILAEPVADILSLGRISKVKRIETLIEALRMLKEKGLQYRTNIYGSPARSEDGEYLMSLQDLSVSYHLQNDTHWKGGVSNAETPSIYATHKIFVRLQGGGGFGKVELEAMSMGIPAIVPTPVYKADFLELGRDLYFPEDDALALADRIKTVLEWSPDKRQAYSRIARSLVVEKHNVEHVADVIAQLLKQAQKG